MSFIFQTKPIHLAVLLLLWPALTSAQESPANQWTLNDIEIIDHSGVLSQSDIRNLFGGQFGTYTGIDLESAIFRDTGANSLHTVEFQTKTPINLTSITLIAEHDPHPRDATFRGLKSWRLLANLDGSGYQEILTHTPTNPYAPPTGHRLDLNHTFPSPYSPSNSKSNLSA